MIEEKPTSNSTMWIGIMTLYHDRLNALYQSDVYKKIHMCKITSKEIDHNYNVQLIYAYCILVDIKLN